MNKNRVYSQIDETHTRHTHNTGWRRLVGSPDLQIIFHKRATKYRSLLRKMTYKDKGSYESSPPCINTQTNSGIFWYTYTMTQTHGHKSLTHTLDIQTERKTNRWHTHTSDRCWTDTQDAQTDTDRHTDTHRQTQTDTDRHTDRHRQTQTARQLSHAQNIN